MVYKGFDEHITHKHGIVIEGWPLRVFDNPSAIGSQVKLNILLRSWQSGTTWFRKMKNDEHMTWLENRAHADLRGPPTNAISFQPAVSSPQVHGQDVGPTPTANRPMEPFNTIPFGSLTLLATGSSQANPPKKPRKARSDKGVPRKRRTQIPGVTTFQVDT